MSEKKYVAWADSKNSTPLEDIRSLLKAQEEAARTFHYETNWPILNYLLICAHVKVPALELLSWDRPKAREAEIWAGDYYVHRFIRKDAPVSVMPEFLEPYYDEKIFPETEERVM